MIPRADRCGSFAVLSIVLLIGGCGDTGTGLIHLAGHAQGTSWHVSVPSSPELDATSLQRALEHELVRIDRLYSNWREDSIVEQFNSAPPGTVFEVGPEFVSLLRRAGEVHQASDGCFDPTIGPLVRAWGFRDDAGARQSAEALTDLQARVGFEQIEIVDDRRITAMRSGVELDLSGIAQGDTLTRLASVVEAAGIADYSIEIGGEVRVRGAKPEGRPWRVGLADPGGGNRDAPLRIEHAAKEALAIATSGTRTQFVEMDGQRLAHIIDPRSARPVAHDTVSVTVLHKDAALADAWSTALLCLGAEAGMDAANRRGIAARFVIRGGAARMSPAWPSG